MHAVPLDYQTAPISSLFIPKDTPTATYYITVNREEVLHALKCLASRAVTVSKKKSMKKAKIVWIAKLAPVREFKSRPEFTDDTGSYHRVGSVLIDITDYGLGFSEVRSNSLFEFTDRIFCCLPGMIVSYL